MTCNKKNGESQFIVCGTTRTLCACRDELGFFMNIFLLLFVRLMFALLLFFKKKKLEYSLKKLISAHIIMTPLRNRSNGTLLALVLLVPVLLLIAYGGWTLLLRPAS
jgi:hypothetical protein